MQRKKTIWVVAGLLALAAIVFFGLRQMRGAASAAPAASSPTAEVFIGDLSSNATASGKVRAQQRASLSAGSPGRVTAVFVQPGDSVSKGDPLLELDKTTLTLNVSDAEQALAIAEANLALLQRSPATADLASAQAGVASAQARLDDLLDGPSAAEIAQATASLDSSQASLRASSANLAQVQASVSEAQLLAAQAELLAAQLRFDSAQENNSNNPNEATHTDLLAASQNLASAQARYDSLADGPGQGDLGAAEADLAAAAARRDASQADLARLQRGASEADIATARAQLAEAQKLVANLQAGASQDEIAAAQAQVEQARVGLADAHRALDEATLIAPFDGVVTAVNIHQGEMAAGTLVELVDISNLTVVLNVDEVDVGQLAVGQPAVITLETWPQQEIEGQIQSIAPSSTMSGNSALVNFEVRISLPQVEMPGPAGSTQPIRPGMTANAHLVTNQLNDILLVPSRAITADRVAQRYTVTRVDASGVEEQVKVTIGLRDGEYTQITSGLAAGDVVRVVTTDNGDGRTGFGFGHFDED